MMQPKCKCILCGGNAVVKEHEQRWLDFAYIALVVLYKPPEKAFATRELAEFIVAHAKQCSFLKTMQDINSVTTRLGTALHQATEPKAIRKGALWTLINYRTSFEKYLQPTQKSIPSAESMDDPDLNFAIKFIENTNPGSNKKGKSRSRSPSPDKRKKAKISKSPSSPQKISAVPEIPSFRITVDTAQMPEKTKKAELIVTPQGKNKQKTPTKRKSKGTLKQAHKEAPSMKCQIKCDLCNGRAKIVNQPSGEDVLMVVYLLMMNSEAFKGRTTFYAGEMSDYYQTHKKFLSPFTEVPSNRTATTRRLCGYFRLKGWEREGELKHYMYYHLNAKSQASSFLQYKDGFSAEPAVPALPKQKFKQAWKEQTSRENSPIDSQEETENLEQGPQPQAVAANSNNYLNNNNNSVEDTDSTDSDVRMSGEEDNGIKSVSKRKTKKRKISTPAKHKQKQIMVEDDEENKDEARSANVNALHSRIISKLPQSLVKFQESSAELLTTVKELYNFTSLMWEDNQYLRRKTSSIEQNLINLERKFEGLQNSQQLNQSSTSLNASQQSVVASNAEFVEIF